VSVFARVNVPVPIDDRSKSARQSPSTLSQGAHPNREIPGKHAENGEHWATELLRALVQAPVSILEMLRSAPRMIDQKPYPRLNRQSCSGAGWIIQICQG
jgi:hypothetical protein